MEKEEDIKDAKKYYIKVRQPMHNVHKYNTLKLFEGMEYYWLNGFVK